MVLLAFHQQPESLQTLQPQFSGVSSSRESPTEVEIAVGVTKVSTTLEMTGVPEVSTIEWYQKAKSNPKWAVRLLDRATQYVGKLGASSTASSFRKMNSYGNKRKNQTYMMVIDAVIYI